MPDPLEGLEELLQVVRRLRGPGGCEWDRSQTVQSLRPFLLEEAYEAADAAEAGDWDSLGKELGDLLLHIVMSSLIAEEEGRFDLGTVASGIAAKLRRRHPHVFGQREALTPGEVEKQWESIKAVEKSREGFFDSIPRSMPALQASWRIQQRASEVGLDALPADVPGRLESDLPEGAGELGDWLFDFVNYTRLLGHEPEQLLRSANAKFVKRFSAMEALLLRSGTPLGVASPEEVSEAWRTVASVVSGGCPEVTR